MAGRDLAYTDGLSQEELMYTSKSGTAGRAGAINMRERANKAHRAQAQEDEDLARALAASRITAERERNLPGNWYARTGSHRRTATSRPKFAQDSSMIQLARRRSYEIEGLTEEKQLELAMTQSMEEGKRTAKRQGALRYTPPSSEADSWSPVLPSTPRSFSPRHQKQSSCGYERQVRLEEPEQNPWINDPNCLYDPPPWTGGDSGWDHVDPREAGLPFNPAEDHHQNWSQPHAQVREATHANNDGQFHPTVASQYSTRRATVSFYPNSSRFGSHRDHMMPQGMGPNLVRQEDQNNRPPSSSWASPITTSQYSSWPTSPLTEPFRNEGLNNGRPIRYIFKGPVTINHCCCGNGCERADRSSARRCPMHASSRNSCHCNCDSWVSQADGVNRSRGSGDGWCLTPSSPSSCLAPWEVPVLHNTPPLHNVPSRHTNPLPCARAPTASHRQHRAPSAQPTRDGRRDFEYHGSPHDNSSSHASLYDWPTPPRSQYVTQSPSTGRRFPGYEAPGYDSGDARGYGWDE